MTTSLTPALALSYLGELSTDIRSAVVLDGSGAVRAGDAGLARRAGQLLAAPLEPGAGLPAGVRMALVPEGALLVAQALEEGSDGSSIAILAGSQGLFPLLAHDLATVVRLLVASAATGP